MERQTRLTFVTGMCLHELRAPKDKVSLRSSLLKHIKFLAEGSTKADLEPVLFQRVDQALTFKLLV